MQISAEEIDKLQREFNQIQMNDNNGNEGGPIESVEQTCSFGEDDQNPVPQYRNNEFQPMNHKK